MLRELFQKIFMFKSGGSAAADNNEALSECFALLRLAKKQKDEGLPEKALDSFEKVIDIIEREGFYR